MLPPTSTAQSTSTPGMPTALPTILGYIRLPSIAGGRHEDDEEQGLYGVGGQDKQRAYHDAHEGADEGHEAGDAYDHAYDVRVGEAENCHAYEAEDAEDAAVGQLAGDEV